MLIQVIESVTNNKGVGKSKAKGGVVNNNAIKGTEPLLSRTNNIEPQKEMNETEALPTDEPTLTELPASLETPTAELVMPMAEPIAIALDNNVENVVKKLTAAEKKNLLQQRKQKLLQRS